MRDAQVWPEGVLHVPTERVRLQLRCRSWVASCLHFPSVPSLIDDVTASTPVSEEGEDAVGEFLTVGGGHGAAEY